MPDFDHIFVGGGRIKETGMHCPKCVWGRGEHADWCSGPVERPPEISPETWQRLRTARPFEMVEVTPEELEFIRIHHELIVNAEAAVAPPWISSIYDKRT
jgi:hypothetical protein